jgi:hypothetical protein
MLADNRIAVNAGWDAEMLKLELADLGKLGADLKILGFSEQELAAALGAPGSGEPSARPIYGFHRLAHHLSGIESSARLGRSRLEILPQRWSS